MRSKEKIAQLRGMLEFVPGLSNECKRLFEVVNETLCILAEELEAKEIEIALLEERLEEMEEVIGANVLECDSDDEDDDALDEASWDDLEEELEEESRFQVATCGKCGLKFPYDPEAFEEMEDVPCPACGEIVVKG